MPDPKDGAKGAGEFHPPRTEQEDGTAPAGTNLARDLEEESRPGRGENQAGFLKEKDEPGTDPA